jgi:hypothetical protein
LKIIIIICIILFLVILIMPTDYSNKGSIDPIRIIAGTSIDTWPSLGDYSRVCEHDICNI